LAAFQSNESKLFALESGADAYLIQPADPVVLVATVKSLVRLNSAESKARLAAQQWQATFDALTEGVAIVGADGIVQRCNRTMTSLLGKTYGEIENASLADLVHRCFGPETEIPAGARLIEVKSGSRFFRLSFDPIAPHQGVLEGNIFIVGEATKQKLAEEALLISERLAATGRMMALNNRGLVEKRLCIRTEWNATVPIWGFPAQLHQVFSNLIRNAIEASFPEGEIRIRTSDSRIWHRPGTRAVHVSIADKGIGIPRENLGKIFDAFFTTEDLKRSGIGLWLGSTIIHEQGGSLRVRSTDRPCRSGTCFSDLLPCGPVE
jgi:sensor histidine kinase regulating citrate/malate metabolism